MGFQNYMYIKLRSKANKDSTAYRANERKQKQNIYINKIKYNKYKKIKISWKEGEEEKKKKKKKKKKKSIL